ncbi:MAG: hypothetical protein AB4352_26795, partial [Hormoscilla sp.]
AQWLQAAAQWLQAAAQWLQAAAQWLQAAAQWLQAAAQWLQAAALGCRAFTAFFPTQSLGAIARFFCYPESDFYTRSLCLALNALLRLCLQEDYSRGRASQWTFPARVRERGKRGDRLLFKLS